MGRKNFPIYENKGDLSGDSADNFNNFQSPNAPKLTYISGKVAASPNIPPPIRPIDPKLAREARTIDVQKKWYWPENAAH